MQEQIIQNLNLIKYHQNIKIVTQRIEQLSKLEGYCPALLNIINSNCADQILIAAASQLKNIIRKNWIRPMDINLSTHDRMQILSQLLPTFTKKNHKLKIYKLLKDVVALLGKSLVSQTQKIAILLKDEISIRGCLYYLLGVIQSFAFCFQKEEFEDINQILNYVLPILLTCLRTIKNKIEVIQFQIKINPTSQQLNYYESQLYRYTEYEYLSIKFLSKATYSTINSNNKKWIFEWVQYVIEKIRYKNQLFEPFMRQQNCGEKQTIQFFYWQSRKWSMKFIEKIYEKILYSESKSQQYDQLSRRIVQTLINSLKSPQNNKTRYYSLRCIESITHSYQRSLLGHYKLLSFQILPKLLMFEQEDNKIAHQNPTLFILIQQCSKNVENQNTRSIATRIWMKLSKIGSNFDRPGNYLKGDIIYQHLVFIQQSIRGNNSQFVELGMYLLIKMHQYYKFCEIALQIIVKIIIQVAFVSFQKENITLQMRSIDLIRYYHKVLPTEYYESIKEVVFYFLLHQNTSYPLLKLKATDCYSSMLDSNYFRALDKVRIEPILQNIVQVAIKYEYEPAIRCLNKFVAIFINQIKQYNKDLVSFLTEMFFTYMNKDIQTSNHEQYSDNVFNLATGIIRTISSMSFCKDQIFAKELEEQVLKILQAHFLLPDQISDIYNEEVISMFKNFLKNRYGEGQVISEDFWFYYMVIIIRFVGMPKQSYSLIDELNLSENKKQILKKYKVMDIQVQHSIYMDVMKKFISQIDPRQEVRSYEITKSNIFQANVLEILFYMIYKIYKVKRTQQFEQFSKHRSFATFCLMLLIQKHTINLKIETIELAWPVLLNNIISKKFFPYVFKLNFQLFCLLMSTAPEILLIFLDQLHKSNRLSSFLNILFQSRNGYSSFRAINQIFECRRVIKGLTNFLIYSKNRIEMKQNNQIVVMWIIDYVKFLVNQSETSNLNDKIYNYNMRNTQPDDTLEEVDLVIDLKDLNNNMHISQFELQQYAEEGQDQRWITEVLYFLEIMKMLKQKDEIYYKEIMKGKYQTLYQQILKKLDHDTYNQYISLYIQEEIQSDTEGI